MTKLLWSEHLHSHILVHALAAIPTVNTTCCLVIQYRSQTNCYLLTAYAWIHHSSLTWDGTSQQSFQLITHFVSTLVGASLQPIISPHSKFSRNPEHHERSTFEDLARELSTDSEALLSWSQQDKETSSKASVLGATLEKGKHLYPDLQNKY